MCGIMGLMGGQKVAANVLEGLRRLEYRGYDSSGIALVREGGEVSLYKKKGSLLELFSYLEGVSLGASCALGHTRWATHGQVSDANAHPHRRGPLVLVHNGIIENADQLRSQFSAEEFLSETDSEVFLFLVERELQQGKDFLRAMANAFDQVQGNSAFVIMHSELQEIVAVKRGVPLVCGSGDVPSSGIISSDPYALLGFSRQLYFPEDGVLCSLSKAHKGGVHFYDQQGNSSQRFHVRTQSTVDFTPEVKGEFEHFMLKEIHEQPALIRALAPFYFAGDGGGVLESLVKDRPSYAYLVACGTAAYAGQLIQHILMKQNGIPSWVELGSEFRYGNPIFPDGSRGILISQSGETADTLAACRLCAERKVPTLALVNVEGSTLYRESDQALLIRAGTEIGVASTKAFTQMVLAGHLMSFAWLEGFFIKKERDKMRDAFNLLADRIEELFGNIDLIRSVAMEIHNRKGYLYTGRGHYYPVALEGALKLKEIAYVHAEGYASGELKHGPIALIDEEMVNIALAGPEFKDKALVGIQEVKARKGVVVGIGPRDFHSMEKACDYFIPMNYDGLDHLAPIYVNVANQLLAYYMAKFKGTDIDRPRNLAKSVTVE